jgi:5'-nucleotidase
MGAAFAGSIFQIPSIGFSMDDHALEADFSHAKKIVAAICQKVLKSGLPYGICLNINIPKGAEIKGIKICHQTKGKWVEEFVASTDGIGHKVFWLTGSFSNDEPNNIHTDEWALANGYVSVVPTKVDMTAYDFIEDIKGWEEGL